jgi:hypothetical protein
MGRAIYAIMESESDTGKALATELRKIGDSLNLVMRYVLAGGVLVLTVGTLRTSHFRFLIADPSDKEHGISLPLSLLFIFVSGAAIYLLHRGLLYPTISRCLSKKLVTIHESDWPLDTPKGAEELEEFLTSRRLKRPKVDPISHAHLRNWAAEVHALYCVGYGLLAGLIIGICSAGFAMFDVLVAGATLLICGAAWSHNLRFRWAEINSDPKPPAISGEPFLERREIFWSSVRKSGPTDVD